MWTNRFLELLDRASQAVEDSGLAAWCTASHHDLRWAIPSSSNIEAVTHWSRDKEKAFVYSTFGRLLYGAMFGVLIDLPPKFQSGRGATGVQGSR